MKIPYGWYKAQGRRGLNVRIMQMSKCRRRKAGRENFTIRWTLGGGGRRRGGKEGGQKLQRSLSYVSNLIKKLHWPYPQRKKKRKNDSGQTP